MEEKREKRRCRRSALRVQSSLLLRERGGTWYAKMRKETSLRYLKAMTERGLVKYEILNDSQAK